MNPSVNLYAAWIAILVGFITGAGVGMFFHREDWLGGYGTWKRRLLRLGHISFFGLAFVNLAFVFTVGELSLCGPLVNWAAALFLLGLLTMPAVCFASAFRAGARYCFVVPVGSLIAAATLVLIAGAHQ